MKPTHAHLSALLSGLAGSPDRVKSAHAENMLLDERVDPNRQSAYESSLPATAADWTGDTDTAYQTWIEAHADYLAGAVTVDLPETFLACNQAASLSPTVTSRLGEDQVLVRVECLDHALTHTKVGTLADLAHGLAVYRGEIKDERMGQADAKALLEEVCRSLNTNPYAVRPRFAAFAQELDEDIAAADWADRLRDRLGLAHYPPKQRTGPWPVILMRYKVREVANRARRAGAGHALTVPTVLDDRPYEIFHPAPCGADYGRTLHLGDNSNCDRLASEVLHLRIDYSPSHIWKIGAIRTRADISDDRLAQLRETHLFCLCYSSGRDDFGRF